MKQWQKDRLKGIEAQRLGGCHLELLIDEYYQVNVKDAEIKNGKIYIGMARTQGPNEVTAKMYVKTWNGKVKVDCEKFKYTITAKAVPTCIKKSK